MKNFFRCILIAGVFLAGGCASVPVYKQVFKEENSYNRKKFNVSKNVLYQAVIEAVCSKNFVIENEDEKKGFILSKRYFQRGKRDIILALQAKIVPEGDKSSSLYLNAVETTERLYVADRTRFFLFIIPLPGGGGRTAAKIKEGEKIVEDKEFYQDFFSLIEKKTKNIDIGETSKETVKNEGAAKKSLPVQPYLPDGTK